MVSMSSPMTAAIHTTRSSALHAILAGGLIGGAFDLTFAIVFYAVRTGGSPIKIPQVVASGVLGVSSFQGGLASAALGVVLHFVIALGAASIYYLASRRLPLLTRKAVPCGMAFGACIYLTMNLVIVPLSNAPHFKHTVVGTVADLIVHVFLIGLSISLSVRRWGR